MEFLAEPSKIFEELSLIKRFGNRKVELNVDSIANMKILKMKKK